MSRPKTVTTPIAATATRATMIRYSLSPCPSWDWSSLRTNRRMAPPLVVLTAYIPTWRPSVSVGDRRSGRTVAARPRQRIIGTCEQRRSSRYARSLARTVGGGVGLVHRGLGRQRRSAHRLRHGSHPGRPSSEGGHLVGQPAGSLFSGGERAPRISRGLRERPRGRAAGR